MQSEVDFHRAMHENPEDENLLDVYADWLEENDRHGTAEVIRRQNKLTRTVQATGHPVRRGVYIYDFQQPPSHSIRYATSYPKSGEDAVSIQLPSLHEPDKTFTFTAWLPRKSSKRLTQQLVKEGLTHLPQDDEHERRFAQDTTTEPEPYQMSRFSSYINRRLYLTKKYAKTTVARVMGHKPYDKDISDRLKGSRLATVLREIQHGPIGKANPRVATYAQKALSGTSNPKVFKQLRDELFNTNHPRAVEIARGYNWHKVGEGLERDSILHKFVEHASSRGRYANSGLAHRKFYNHIVMGDYGASDEERMRWYDTMQRHLYAETGKVHSFEDIQDSLRRNGETEENLERIRGSATARPTLTKGNHVLNLPEYPHPAYRGTPKPGKYPPSKNVNPREMRAPGQFNRRRDTLRQYASRWIPRPDPVVLHGAIERAMHEAELLPSKRMGESSLSHRNRQTTETQKFLKLVSDHLEDNPSDTLSNYYWGIVKKLRHSGWGRQRLGSIEEQLMPAVLPLVRYLAEKTGYHKANTSYLDNPHLDPMMRASGHVLPADEYEEEPPVDLADETTHADPFETTSESKPHASFTIENMGGYHPDSSTDFELSEPPNQEIPEAIPVNEEPEPEPEIPEGVPHYLMEYRSKEDRKAIVQSIADYTDKNWFNLKPTHEDLQGLTQHLIDTHGLAPKEAALHINNFHRRKREVIPTREPNTNRPTNTTGSMGNQVPTGLTKRSNRLSRRTYQPTDLLSTPLYGWTYESK